MEDRGSSRWAALAILYTSGLCWILVWQSIPPVLGNVIEAFHVSHGQAGLLMSVFSLPGIFVSLPAGMLADRYGTRRVGVGCLLVMLAGTASSAVGQTFPVVLCGRLVAGVGAMGLSIICPQAVAQWFLGREMGIAMGLYNTVMPVGTIASLNAFTTLTSAWGWRSALWATVAASTLALAVLWLFLPPGSAVRPGPARRTGSTGSSLATIGAPIWLVSVTWALFNTAIVSFFTFAPNFMVGNGLALGTAGFYTSLAMIGPLALSPVVGYLLDKVGRQAAFISGGCLGAALVLVLMPKGMAHIGLLAVALGAAAAFVPAPIFSRAAEVVPPDRIGIGFGVLYTLNNVGLFVGPQLIGLSRDLCGSYRVAFPLMALTAALAPIGVVASELVARRGRTAA